MEYRCRGNRFPRARLSAMLGAGHSQIMRNSEPCLLRQTGIGVLSASGDKNLGFSGVPQDNSQELLILTLFTVEIA